MTERIKKYKRYSDYWALDSMEVKLSLFLTIIFSILLLGVFDFYNSFFEFQDDVKQLLLTIVGGEFGLLGMSLAGMAIITTLFSPDMIATINKIDKNDVINRLLSQYEFSALNLAIQISYFIVLYFSLVSIRNITNKYFFTFVFVVSTYHFFFNLFYIIALIGMCIKINAIKDLCNRVSQSEKSQISVANEVRIDYILAMLLKEREIKRTQMLEDLEKIIDLSNIKNKQEIKDYLKSYYTGK